MWKMICREKPTEGRPGRIWLLSLTWTYRQRDGDDGRDFDGQCRIQRPIRCTREPPSSIPFLTYRDVFEAEPNVHEPLLV
eukprot:bmy_14232T0